MKNKKIYLILLPVILVGLIFFLNGFMKGSPEKARIIPVEDFFKNPDQTRYQISPDGKYFSFMAPYEKRMNVFVQEIGKDKPVRLTSETDRDIAGYFWKNPGRILFLKDTGGDENYRLYGVDVDGSDLICFTDFPKVRTNIIDELDDFPDEVIIGLNKRNAEVFDAYRLNIKTGKMDMIAENPGTIQGWIIDHAGKLRAAVSIVDGVNTRILYRDNEADTFRSIITTNFRETINPMVFTADNKFVYATSNLNRDKESLIVYDIANNKEKEMLYENPKYDISGIGWSKKDKKIYSAEFESWKTERKFFDPEWEKIFNNIKKQAGEDQIVIVSMNKPEDKFIIRTYSDRSLGSYFVYDRKTEKLTHIVDVAPWLKKEELAKMEPIDFKSRDGKDLSGYLTLPVGFTMKDAKNLPVVVNPHGGPWYRDSWGFNPEVQFLANRGYAVLQINFRGSTGYGKEFWQSSFKKWGQTMQEDITDGVKWLIAKGIADPKRVAIYGGSYGGYATLQGLVKDPDLYAAGVDYVGVSNLFTFMNTIPPYWRPMRDMFYEMVGDPVKDSLLLAQNSPALNADKIKAPLFIAQGANDPRVNKNESDQMVEALKKRGVTVQYMVKDNEGHGFRNEENRFDFYRAMEKFLGEHLK